MLIDPQVPLRRKHGALSCETIGLEKRFGSFVALQQVSLQIRAGSFHALLGENGAGKSTLVKCLVGYQQPSAGSICFDEQERTLADPREAGDLGIGMVYQTFTLIDNMTVLQNLVLSRDPIPAYIPWKTLRQEYEAFFDQVPFRLPLDARVGSLSSGQKQKLEILKQLSLRRRLLILDEPTSALTPEEADEVLGFLKRLTQAHTLTVLLITHKFRELMRYADSYTVLRRGRMVSHGNVADTNPDALAVAMVGEAMHTSPHHRTPTEPDAPPVLSIQDLWVANDRGDPAVRGLSLQVRPREIVGIAGVSGNGQTELIETLAGCREAISGTILVKGQPFRGEREQLHQAGVSLIPEIPLLNATVGEMSVEANLALRNFDRPPLRHYGCLLSFRALRQQAAALIRAFGVKAATQQVPIATLSGGNVQRAVLARELSCNPTLLIAANPCFGLDFKATAAVRSRIMAARNAGAAVLIISEDLDEIRELSDRLCVIFAGRLVHETSDTTTDARIIGSFMAGSPSQKAPKQE